MEREQRAVGVTNVRDVIIPLGSSALRGALQVPEAAQGVVLLVQTSVQTSLPICEQMLRNWLSSAGLGTLQLALLTPSENVIDQQTRHLRFDLPLLARRLVTVAGWVGRQPDLAALRLGFCGARLGAGVALLAAADLGTRLSAVVSYDGRPDLAGAALARVTAPTLLLVGDTTGAMTELNQAALALLPGIKAFQLVPGAPQFFDEPNRWADVAMHVATWFQHYLRDSASNALPSSS